MRGRRNGFLNDISEHRLRICLHCFCAQLDSLNEEADRLEKEKPEEAEAIRERITQITELWLQLKEMVTFFNMAATFFQSENRTVRNNIIDFAFCFQQLKVRDERLGEANELQKFLQNLDHFQQWLTRTQTAIASEDYPNDLAEAERLLNEHQQLKEEIDAYAPDYAQMKEYGITVVEGQEDVQYMFLREVCSEYIHS